MRLRQLALLGVLLGLARPAEAASITVDNLWDFPITFFSLWADNTRLLSTDQPIRADNYLDVPITVANPVEGFTSRTWTLPANLMGQGFIFGGLTLGGPLPNDSGWSLGPDDLFAGDLIGLGSTAMDIFWPLGATDGGPISIVRVVYTSDPPIPSPDVSTPEPTTGALLLIAGTLMLASRWRVFVTP
jgi:hypothetical protein